MKKNSSIKDSNIYFKMRQMKCYNENENEIILSTLLIIVKKYIIGCISIDKLNLLFTCYDEF